MALALAKLEKLKILAFKNAERTEKSTGCCEFEAMFNPSSIKKTHSIVWGTRQAQNSSGKQLSYARSEPTRLDLNLLLDGTSIGMTGASQQKTVSERLQEFLDVTFSYNGDIHEPNYLVVAWGDLELSCRLHNVDVTYDLFDRDGKPLRAELRISLLGDDEDKLRARREQKSSPDLTHVRIVRKGDTLPLLTRQIYGCASHYLGVARVNDLDHFRNLTPGSKIFFPPLDRVPA